MDHQSNEKLNVLYWNANSIKPKIHQFYNFMLENHTDIACLSETLLGPGDVLPTHPSFIIYRNDRDNCNQNRRSGGVAIIVRRIHSHKLLPVLRTQIIENIGVEFSLQNGARICIYSVYLPGGTSNKEIKQHYKNDLRILTSQSRSYFALGDYNSKHRSWNCVRANTAGNILYNEHVSRNFFIQFPSEPTRYSPNGKSLPSTIDLCLTNLLHQTSDFLTHTSESDHQIVTFEIHLSNSTIKPPSHRIPFFHKADWYKFASIVNSSLQDLPQLNEINDTTSIDGMITKFSDTILMAQYRSVPFTNPTSYALNITPEIKAKIQLRNALKRSSQRNPGISQRAKFQINKLNEDIRKDIQTLVNDNFNHKLSNIDLDTSKKSLWQMSKFLKNRHNNIPALKANGSTLITAKEKCDGLADQFAANHRNSLENANVTHTRFINNTVNRFMRNCQQSSLNPEFTNEIEVAQNIRRLKSSKAPGMDEIRNILLKKLPPLGFVYLALIFNACLRLSYFPTQWKHAKVIGIKKPNKLPSDPASYRPLSLLSKLGKLFERIILERLTKHLSDNNIIPEQQHAWF